MRIQLVSKEIRGQNSLELVKEIVRSCRLIKKIQIVPYIYTPMIQERIKVTEGINRIFSSAMELRDQLQLPFWDSCILALQNSQYSVSEEFIREISFHETHYGKEVFLDREQVLNCELQAFLSVGLGSQLVSVLSEVVLDDNKKMNLPLLDFHCPIEPSNQQLAFQICKTLLPEGFVLLKSDSSYHCFGLTLISQDELISFLAKALFYSPIIDRAYIAHQLLEKRCSLRISGKANKSALPTVIEAWQEGWN